jgi:beta-lactamase superfamily II metal-dependent hydrolase
MSETEELKIHVIDTEGGKAMIVLPPGGESMLVDAGYPVPEGRDTHRIVAAAAALGIKHFDYIVATHYDKDHSGNIPNLDARMPGRVFIDHGDILPTVQDENRQLYYLPYLKAIAGRQRMVVRPGDVLPLKGVRITVVSAGGEALTRPVQGEAEPNPLCASGLAPQPLDLNDNAGSVGLLYEFGRFRMLDLADLLQAVEYRLMCPANVLGTVDLFMVSHHGYKASNSRLLVHSVRPRVAILNNSARKGGEPEVLDILRSSPGFQDLWQMHRSTAAGEKNAPEDFIANPGEPCEARAIAVTALYNGIFTVTNTGNNFSRTY